MPTCRACRRTASRASWRSPQARAAVVHYIAASRRWESFQGIAPRPYGGSARSPSCAYVRWAARLWQARATKLAAALPPHYAFWLADAKCELGSDYPGGWHDQVGIYQGGIRFYHGTWDGWKINVPGAARYADAQDAPVWVQMRVAEWGYIHVGRWGCTTHAEVLAFR